MKNKPELIVIVFWVPIVVIIAWQLAIALW